MKDARKEAEELRRKAKNRRDKAAIADSAKRGGDLYSQLQASLRQARA